MLAIRHVNGVRCTIHRSVVVGFGLSTSLSSAFAASPFSSLEPAAPSTSVLSSGTLHAAGFPTSEVVATFREWFQWGNIGLFSRIFEILSADNGPDHSSSDHALSLLNLPLSESFVLDVLLDGRRRPSGVLLCLKFFDWAGRQPRFYHTRATFHAMFKILSMAKRESQMMDFLEDIGRNAYKLRFRDTLVMGYALAGKSDVALHLFGKMRFNGLELDSYTYRVLLNALVEDNCFDAVKALEKQVLSRTHDNVFIHSVMVKYLCKRNQLDHAMEYVNGLLKEGKEFDAHLLGTLVPALCEHGKFEQAQSLIEQFRELGVVQMDEIYGIWLRELVRAGKLDRAFEFLQSKKQTEGYIPDVFRFNMLIYKFLRKNRVWDVFDLLVEMKENKIPPDWQTVNVTLCFFCKIGMVEVALELYNSCSEFIFSPSCMFYNYLINALCGTNGTAEAYQVWKSSIDSGYFPGKKSFSILTDALYRENKLNEMMELILAALERDFVPSSSTYDRFVLALCKTSRIEEGYELHRKVSEIPRFSHQSGSFIHLIRALIRSSRGDMAADLLIDMQKKGHLVQRSLYKSVIQCLTDMDNPMARILSLLERQLSYSGPKIWFFNFFINGVGNSKNSELAREIYERMKRNGINPNITSDILVLKSYLKSGRISDALNFYGDIKQRRVIKRRLYSALIVGLCEAKSADYALKFFKEMRTKGLIPSIECYEYLILLLCSCRYFENAVKIVDDFMKTRCNITSFIGNTLLWHSLQTPNLYEAWICSREEMDGSSDVNIGRLLAASSGRTRMVVEHVEDVEQVIRQCFPPDIFTYNLLLRILGGAGEVSQAIYIFDWICKKGLEPNRWTYDIIIHSLLKHGRREEARQWYEEMHTRGFSLTSRTRSLL
ncbi:hypothetical protein SAY87_018442 [Trapa incisa]|uniref:Pentatricopeptide repeat-containing protein n=1 Tax=Trapa incisa TaxID=236973 RepID=A0AAN7LAT7_9MYRT|nr:hypothetical protein SAY87_018442 [Trapa incisa]